MIKGRINGCNWAATHVIHPMKRFVFAGNSHNQDECLNQGHSKGQVQWTEVSIYVAAQGIARRTKPIYGLRQIGKQKQNAKVFAREDSRTP
jgi:hypothetical protein